MISFKALTTVMLAAALAACGAADPAAPAYTMSGTWRQSGDLRDTVNGVGHIHLGTYTLVQSGDSFSGTGQQTGFCHGDQGDFAGPLVDGVPFPVTGGRVAGTSISFQTNICRFEGHFEPDNPRRVVGGATCDYTRDGIDYHFAGTWQADH